MANNLSNYLKGINYERVGKYEEAFNIFQNDSSDFSLSKLVIYEYLGLGIDKNYKSSLENLKKISLSLEDTSMDNYEIQTEVAIKEKKLSELFNFKLAKFHYKKELPRRYLESFLIIRR